MSAPSSPYRPELPPVPERMRSLPIRRGYPVPWFVPFVDGDYHFPTSSAIKMHRALKENRCWVCGQPLGSFKAFVIGPMCAVNRNTSEPPCHAECAEFSAKACPFLARPHMKRRQDHPDGVEPPAGISIDRNPGVALVWITRSFKLRRIEGDEELRAGILIQIGEPTQARWFAQGRAATREEVMASIDSGMPILREIAAKQGEGALQYLQRLYDEVIPLVPA